MAERKPPTYAKKPQPLEDNHDCTKSAVLIERLSPKYGSQIKVWQCRICGEIWEEEEEKK